MDKIQEIKAKLRLTVGAEPNLPIQATVVSVEGETCTVRLASGFEIDDIRLKSTVGDGDNYLLQTPAVGSDVTLLSSDGTVKNMFVVLMDDLESFRFSHGGLKIEFDGADGKVLIKNNQTSLYKLLDDLSMLLKQLKVYTAMGPSGTPLPDTILAIEAFEIGFKQLLKED